MKIKEIMNRAMAVDHDITLREAAKIMSEKNIGCLVVLKNNKIIGIITERDILAHLDKLNKDIFSIMTEKVITISQSENLDVAALLMSKNKIRRLPVIANDGELVGLITSTDLIAHSEDLNDEFLFD
jgi:CBS domain-containing protein